MQRLSLGVKYAGQGATGREGGWAKFLVPVEGYIEQFFFVCLGEKEKSSDCLWVKYSSQGARGRVDGQST